MKAGRQRSDATAHASSTDVFEPRSRLLAVYRCMLLSRKLDDKEIQLKNQSQIFFQISGAGHEAVLVAAGLTLKPATTGSSPTIAIARCACSSASRRSRCCSRRSAPRTIPSSGGRQMPSHWGHTGAQHRLGLEPDRHAGAARGRRRGSRRHLQPRRRRFRIARRAFTPTRSSYVSLGEGATSEGEFWEALNIACTASSCRCCSWSKTTATRSRCRSKSRRPAATSRGSCDRFPGLHVDSIDGTDFFASLRAMREATAYVRARKGPAFVHARVHPPVLALAVRRREAVQDAGGARGRSAARSDRAVRRVPEDATASPPTTTSPRSPPTSSARSTRRRCRRCAAPKPAKDTADALGLLARRRSDVGGVRHAGAARRQARHDGRGDQPHAEGRDGARPAHRRLRRGRRRRQPEGGAADRARQGRRLQADARPAAALRRRSRVQRAARRSQHRRPRRSAWRRAG